MFASSEISLLTFSMVLDILLLETLSTRFKTPFVELSGGDASIFLFSFTSPVGRESYPKCLNTDSGRTSGKYLLTEFNKFDIMIVEPER